MTDTRHPLEEAAMRLRSALEMAAPGSVWDIDEVTRSMKAAADRAVALEKRVAGLEKEQKSRVASVSSTGTCGERVDPCEQQPARVSASGGQPIEESKEFLSRQLGEYDAALRAVALRFGLTSFDKPSDVVEAVARHEDLAKGRGSGDSNVPGAEKAEHSPAPDPAPLSLPWFAVPPRIGCNGQRVGWTVVDDDGEVVCEVCARLGHAVNAEAHILAMWSFDCEVGTGDDGEMSPSLIRRDENGTTWPIVHDAEEEVLETQALKRVKPQPVAVEVRVFAREAK
jgi:hypothetical protein